MWAPEPVWADTGNLALTGLRTLDRPPRSKSLYRLCYPYPHVTDMVAFLLSIANMVAKTLKEIQQTNDRVTT